MLTPEMADALNFTAAAIVTIAAVSFVLYLLGKQRDNYISSEVMLLVTTFCSLLAAIVALAATDAGYKFFAKISPFF